MLIFDLCIKLRQNIDSLDEEIIELYSIYRSPRTQNLSFTPSRSNYINNNSEELLEKIESLKNKRSLLIERSDKNWLFINKRLVQLSFSEADILLFKLRFYYGLPWKKCCEKMNYYYSNIEWNENLIFRIYHKASKHHYFVYS